MNNGIFREFAEKLDKIHCPNAGKEKYLSIVRELTRETFSPAYELLEEARQEIEALKFDAHQMLSLLDEIASPLESGRINGEWLRQLHHAGKVKDRIAALLGEDNLESKKDSTISTTKEEKCSWISVKEGMPSLAAGELGRDFWCNLETLDCHQKPSYNQGKVRFVLRALGSTESSWLTLYGDRVTHWQPLPNPPNKNQ